MTKRIVVTGMGMVTPLGLNVAETWANIKACKSGVTRITRFDSSSLDTQIGAEVKGFDASQWLGSKEARRMDRYAQFAVVAALEACAQANYHVTPENTFETGVIIGAGFGGSETFQEGIDTLYRRGPKKISPFTFPMVLNNMGSAQVAMRLGIRGTNFTVSAACATGAVAIGEGAELIRRGDVNAVIAGGSEASFALFSMAGLNAMKALSTRNDSPETASRPFDATRDGFVPAEGAAVLLLESLESAQARGATILAELVGYGCTCDASHVSAPDPEGIAIVRAMQRAMQQAGITPQDIDYINAHGTSTPLNDANETRMIKKVFGERAYQIPVSSTKSMIGHAMSSSGSMEAIFSIMALRDGFIPATINYQYPDPECDLDYVPNTPRTANLRYVMSNSFGFGGQNAVLIFKRWEEGGETPRSAEGDGLQ
ncbi:MAG: beta-ketoacyl-ACP synthase II [Anaerolineae bacterium]|nr:beta-ketoacyl-ACP synthase II [Anaerolineae bacterium]MDW8299497.1 beta-ketoacyl-ACP synthase II [Anaerolineae bacterium]